jgi:hypothetical protein
VPAVTLRRRHDRRSVLAAVAAAVGLLDRRTVGAVWLRLPPPAEDESSMARRASGQWCASTGSWCADWR